MRRRQIAIRSTSVVAALLTGGALLAAAAATNIEPVRSTITATFKQSGVPVDAEFRHFSGRIDFNPARPESTTATIEVQTGTLDLGDEPYNAEVRKKAWLDSKTYPAAAFTSTAVKPAGPDRFSVTGRLAIKGKVQSVTLPISVRSTPNGTAFDGTFQLSRKAWGIGDPAWKDVLDDVVVIHFHLISSAR